MRRPARPTPGSRATGFTPAASGRDGRQGGGDDAVPPEPSLADMLKQLNQMAGELKQDMRQLETEQDSDRQPDQFTTALGSIYEVMTAAVPNNRRRMLYEQLSELAADCGLPHGAAACRRMNEALLREHRAAHALRGHLVHMLRHEKEAGVLAAVADWRSLPPPRTAAEWEREAQALAEVAGALRPSSEARQAALLLRKYSAAAARAEAEGSPDPLLQLLAAVPRPGALAWPPAMALALALASKWSRELEPSVVLRLSRGADGSLVVQETKLTAAGVGKATRQLRLALRLLAWLHRALGAPLPRLEGLIVVPATERRRAQRRLRGACGSVRDLMPGGGGDTFELSIQVVTV